MTQTYIENISSVEGKEATVKGWLYHKRSSGKVQFLLIRDGTGIIQAVVSAEDVGQETFDLCDKLTQESSLVLEGTVKQDDRAPGGYELSARDIRLVQIADEYPITPKEHSTSFLMQHRHLWLRSRQQHAILRIRSTLVFSLRAFFEERGFTLVDSPVFTPAACEGTSTLFETDYFGEKAYLSQSGQLYNEAAAMALGKVYCFGPTFRAEKSKTRRHLTEFWMLEPEIAYATMEEAMELSEDMILYALEMVLDKRKGELEELGRDTQKLSSISKPFPRLTYDQAVQKLKESGEDFEWGEDFGGGHETIISSQYDAPVFVHRFARDVKAFYMEPDPEDERLVLGFDMIAPEGYGEIVGGGQRIHDLKLLEQRIREHQLPEEAFRWYMDLRKYGSVPHSGFGLGLERTVTWICGRDHLREAIPFPRMLYKIYP
jgi:asparaginyl-tRNA synthetase